MSTRNPKVYSGGFHQSPSRQGEARKRQWDEDEQRRLERAREAETQRRLRRSLVKHTECWERAERLRAFIKGVKNCLKSASLADPDR